MNSLEIACTEMIADIKFHSTMMAVNYHSYSKKDGDIKNTQDRLTTINRSLNNLNVIINSFLSNKKIKSKLEIGSPKAVGFLRKAHYHPNCYPMKKGELVYDGGNCYVIYAKHYHVEGNYPLKIEKSKLEDDIVFYNPSVIAED